jgi:hypothetical protein
LATASASGPEADETACAMAVVSPLASASQMACACAALVDELPLVATACDVATAEHTLGTAWRRLRAPACAVGWVGCGGGQRLRSWAAVAHARRALTAL